MKPGPMVVGLTGGIGAGKSLAASCFRRLGARVVVADELVGQLLETTAVLDEIRSLFGGEVFGPEGLDREKLAERVFSDRVSRRMLEMILHPRVAALAAGVVADAGRKELAVVVYEVPLLLEIGAHQWVDQVVVVRASESVRIRRLVDQRGYSEQHALARIRTQVRSHDGIAGAVVLENDGSVEELCAQARTLYGLWVSQREKDRSRGGVHGAQEQ